MASESNKSLPRFSLPPIVDSGNEWGPSSDYLPEQFKDIPYAPFSKSDRLGKVADWSAEGQNRLQHETRRQNRRDQAYGAGGENPFAYQHTADDASFSIVDNRVNKKTTFSRGGKSFRGSSRNNARGGGFQKFDSSRGRSNFQGKRRFGWKDYDRQRNQIASVQVGPEWTVVEEIELNRIAKLTHKIASEAKDLSFHGQLSYYNKKFDKPSRADSNLKQIETVKYNVTASEDPVIQEISKSGDATVFFSDTVLALLMCSPRSIAPWDIIVNRVGDQVFFDKRDGGPLDTVTVNENAADPPADNPAEKDNINSASNLSVEALYVNQNYQAQVLDYSQVKQMDKPNPFHETEDDSEVLGSCAYRYRQYSLSDTLNMVVRSEIDAIQKSADGQEHYVLVRALNEFDSKATGSGGALDWRSKLESQRGAVVATEMKNNNCKLTRWAVQAMLAGASQLKLGWVSRVSPKESRRHQILTTMQYRPQDFVSQMNFQLSNGWGIVYTIVRLCLQLEEGRYIMVKDPNKPIIRLYSIPADAFDEAEAHSDSPADPSEAPEKTDA